MRTELPTPERIDWDVYRYPDGTLVIGMMGEPDPTTGEVEFPEWQSAVRRRSRREKPGDGPAIDPDSHGG